jgi:hypothetical protein
MFSAQQLFDLKELVEERNEDNRRTYKETLQVVANAELVKMKKEILDKRDKILEELGGKCYTFNHPKELCVKIYQYSRNDSRTKNNKKIWRHDVITKTDLLYRLTEDLFDFTYFKIWTQPSSEGDGEMDIMLGYFPEKVPLNFRQSDPTMPPLSPISVVEPEDNESDNARCYCQT